MFDARFIGVDLLNVMNLIGLSKVFQILNELIERCVVGSHDDLRDTHLALIGDSLSCHTEVFGRIDLKREVGVFVGQELLAGDCRMDGIFRSEKREPEWR